MLRTIVMKKHWPDCQNLPTFPLKTLPLEIAQLRPRKRAEGAR